jgi:hypothetical protein
MAFPTIVFIVSFLALASCVWLGVSLNRRKSDLNADERADLGVVLAASLTLLGLIIGFSFSMGVSRYDQRKNLEEEESNAIGTEYMRASLLPATDGLKIQSLLKDYLAKRILFYESRDRARLPQISIATEKLQGDLWAALQAPATKPSPIVALAVAGMNDVLNSESYTQAAWWNRIPLAAWILMITIAMCCHFLIGFSARRDDRKKILFVALPLIVSISFFLIADIDSPRGGVILVRPVNLLRLSRSLNPH